MSWKACICQRKHEKKSQTYSNSNIFISDASTWGPCSQHFRANLALRNLALATNEAKYLSVIDVALNLKPALNATLYDDKHTTTIKLLLRVVLHHEVSCQCSNAHYLFGLSKFQTKRPCISSPPSAQACVWSFLLATLSKCCDASKYSSSWIQKTDARYASTHSNCSLPQFFAHLRAAGSVRIPGARLAGVTPWTPHK